MAGPALPINRTTASTIAEHVSDHNAAHNVVNKIDKDATPATGDVLTWNGTVYIPSGSAIVTPEAYGAIGNGSTNDQTALVNSAAALTPGDTWLLTGRYAHSSAPEINADNVTVTGGGTLISTGTSYAALQVNGDNVEISNVTFTASNIIARSTNPWMSGLEVGNLGAVTGFKAKDVTVVGSGAAGVFLWNGCSYFTLENVTVLDTWADGIHITDGCHHGLISNCRGINTGDDSIAVVSYEGETVCNYIDIIGCKSYNSKTRGISVVGGEDCRILDAEVYRAASAGIYVAYEYNASWHTQPVKRITVKGFLLEACAWETGSADYGSIHVRNDHATVAIQDIHVSAGRVRDSLGLYAVFRFSAAAGTHTGCQLKDVRATGRLPRVIIEVVGGTLTQENVEVGVRQLVQNPADTGITTPVGNLHGEPGSIVTLLNGSTWIKYSGGQDSNGWHNLSAVVTGLDASAPSTPGGFSTTPGSGQVTLNWTASTGTPAGYFVYWTLEGRNPGQQVVLGAVTTYLKTGLTAGRGYSFQVSAFDAAGNESKRTARLEATPT